MKTKTKRFGILLLSAGMILSAAFATGMILNESDGLIANADNSKGMAVKYESGQQGGGNGTYWEDGPSQMRIDFTFTSAPAANTIFIQSGKDSAVAKQNIGDYVLFDGTAISTMTSSFDWWSLGGAFGTYTLGFCSNKTPNPLTSLKVLTIKQGFTWLLSSATGEWGKDTDMSTCTPCEGATLDKDVVLWNGGANGWLRKATGRRTI